MAEDSRRMGQGKSFAPNPSSATHCGIASGVRTDFAAHEDRIDRARKIPRSCSDSCK